MSLNVRNIRPNGNTLSGIFYEVMKIFSDPISSKIFSLEGPTLYGTLNYLVTGKGDWASAQGSKYFEISFNTGFIFPTHYTMRGANSEWCYQKEWEIYGYNALEKSDSKKWTLLGKNTDEATSKCSNGSLCAGKGITTFPLSYTGKIGFQYIRFVATESSCGPHIVSSGVDFYGSLTGSNILNCYDRSCGTRRSETRFTQYLILILCL